MLGRRARTTRLAEAAWLVALSAGVISALVFAPGLRAGTTQPTVPVAAPGVPAAVNLLAGTSAPTQPIVCRSGSQMVWTVMGKPGSQPSWQLGYDKLVVRQGTVTLDARGAGQLRLTLPEVRTRALFVLLIKSGDAEARRALVLLPKSLLAESAGRLKDLGIGVLDPTARVLRSLRDEGVKAEDLGGDLARDNFRGGAVVLAGFRRAVRLTWVCARFESRLKGGQALIIIDPPPGWSRWGMTAVEPNKPLSGPARFAEGFGRFLKPEDLGAGPWRRSMLTDANIALLVWAQTAKGDANAAEGGRVVLAASRRVGDGTIVVVALPQASDPATNPVGRALLDEALLWILQVHSRKQ